MIELLEGYPGSGKSYYAVAERLLKWVAEGKRIYLYLDGLYLDRLSAFTGMSLETLERQVTNWYPDLDRVKGMPTEVEPGSRVLLDEVQSIFLVRERHEPDLLRWLETHRHYGVDLVLTCQDYRQVTSSVTRLVEVTYKFRRMDRFGLRGRYYCQVRGNPEETEVIRTFTGKYSPKVYAYYYSSYAVAGIKESARTESILKSAAVLAGLAGLGYFGWVAAYGPYGQAAAQGVPVVQAKKPLGAEGRREMGGGERVHAGSLGVANENKAVVRIVGSAGWTQAGRKGWKYLLGNGEILTAAEIAGRFGVQVTETLGEDGIMRLRGEGIEYGPGEP